MHCDLDDMTLSQGHDTPLGHGQLWFEILSRSNMEVSSSCCYGPDMDFRYVCTVTLYVQFDGMVYQQIVGIPMGTILL